jgi:hypothetical protein
MTGKNHKITVEFTENENGQLAKDLESIIKNEVSSVSKSCQNKTKFSNN